MTNRDRQAFLDVFCNQCSEHDSARCRCVSRIFEQQKPIVAEPDWRRISKYLLRTMIEWSVGDESELGFGTFGDVSWRFEPRVYDSACAPYVKTVTFFFFNLTLNMKKEDWRNNTAFWKKISDLMPALNCMRFEGSLRKKIKNIDGPLVLSQIKQPDELLIYKQVLAGMLAEDWRNFEAVEETTFGESPQEFRSYIRKDAEQAVHKNILPTLKAMWRLGFSINAEKVEIPEGLTWSEDE